MIKIFHTVITLPDQSSDSQANKYKCWSQVKSNVGMMNHTKPSMTTVCSPLPLDICDRSSLSWGFAGVQMCMYIEQGQNVYQHSVCSDTLGGKNVADTKIYP